MFNQVGTQVSLSAFSCISVGDSLRRCLAEAHTELHGVTFEEPLVRSPDSALSVDLRWLLCVPVCSAAPLSVRVLPLDVLPSPAARLPAQTGRGRRSSGEMESLFVGRGGSRELIAEDEATQRATQ